jgi:hypothetical protein
MNTKLYRQTPKTFFENITGIKPLQDMVMDNAAGGWRLTKAFNEGGKFAIPLASTGGGAAPGTSSAAQSRKSSLTSLPEPPTAAAPELKRKASNAVA